MYLLNLVCWFLLRIFSLCSSRISACNFFYSVFVGFWYQHFIEWVWKSLFLSFWYSLGKIDFNLSLNVWLLLLLSRFSRVQPYVTPETAAHQAPLSLGFTRQEHWSGLLFPPPMRYYCVIKWQKCFYRRFVRKSRGKHYGSPSISLHLIRSRGNILKTVLVPFMPSPAS